MYIKQLTLENIRSYSEQTVFFPKGTILLSGDIGSGKSTILQAIEFAFFGIIRGELSGSSLLRYDAKKGNVKLTFVLEGSEITITRGLQRSKTTVAQTTGTLEQDGVLEELSAQELTNRIFSLLAYPTHYSHKSQSLLYRYTVYTSQEKMKEILFDQVETRLQTLRALFGVEKYKTISANSQLVLKELRLKKAFLEGQVVNMGELEEHKTELVQQQSEIQLKQTDLAKSLTTLQLSESETKRNLESAQLNYEKMLVLEQEVKKSQADERSLTESLAKVKDDIINISLKKTKVSDEIVKLGPLTEKVDLAPLLEQKESLQEQLFLKKEVVAKRKSTIELLTSQISGLTKQLTELVEAETVLTQNTAQLATINRDLSSLTTVDQTIESYTTAVESLSEKQGAIRARLVQHRDALENLSHDGTCPTCLQLIDEKHKAHSSDEIREKKNTDEAMLTISERTKMSLVSKIEAVKKQLVQKNILLQKQHSVAEEIKQLSQKLADEKELMSHITQKKEQLTELEAVKDADDSNLVQKITDLTQNIQTAQKQNTLITQKEKLQLELDHLTQTVVSQQKNEAELNQKLSVVAKILSESLFSSNKMASVRELLLRAKESLLQKQQLTFSAQKEQSQLDVSLKSCASQLEKVNAELVAKRSQQKKVTSVSNYHTWVKESFVPLMGTLERAVFTSAYQECQNAFSRWFNLLLPDESLHAQLDANFTPKITQDGYETSLEHLSGGEKTSIALVYRLALNHVINQVVSTIKTRDLLILDEPTDGFSFEQLDRVKDVLDQLKLEQLIIVSHEQKVESFVDSIIRVTKTNHVSVVEQL